MAHPRELEVVVYGDNNRVYRPGDQVEGMVFFVPTSQQNIKSLTLDFSGICLTKTTRPLYARPRDGRPPQLEGLQRFKGEATLFKFERPLLGECTVAAKKYSWPFKFTFPSHTQDQRPKWADSSRFSKDAHPLPQSFQAYTDVPRGEATITYGITAKLSCGRRQHRSNREALHRLRFYNDSKFRSHLVAPALKSHLLKEQTWCSKVLRPTKHSLKQKLQHVVTKEETLRTPSIGLLPTVHCPAGISPQQDIPVALSLQHVRRRPAVDPEQIDCTLQSLTISITTYNRSICESGIQDVTQDRRKCVTRSNINTPLPVDGTPYNLVSSLRLNDDAECVATFATFTIARYYTLDVEVAVECGPKTFLITSSTPLEILPGASLSRHAAVEEPTDDSEQLPAYEPRPKLPTYKDSVGSIAVIAPWASSSSAPGSGMPNYRDSLDSMGTIGIVASSSSAGSEGEQSFWDSGLTSASSPFTPPMTPDLTSPTELVLWG